MPKPYSAFAPMVAFACLFAFSSATNVPVTLVYSYTANVGPLNPHLYSPNQMFAQAMVYEPLVKYSSKGTIEPCLAESWSASKDGKEYTFNLRKGVRFSDGTPFNAAAVKKNLDAVKANAARHEWLEGVTQIVEARVVDDSTVKLVLKDSYYPILQDLALVRPLRMLSPSAFPASGTTADGIKAPIGTGPWKLVETKLGEFDRFERNELYWGPRPKADRILVKVIPDPNTRAIALETGQIDLVYGTGQINLDSFKRYSSDKRFTVAMSQPLSTRMLALNTKKGPASDKAVRLAIQHAVDKDSLIKGVFFGTEIKADALYASNIPYADLSLPPYAFDRSQAGKILDDAGWKKDPGTGFRAKGGAPLAMNLCFVGNDAVMKSSAEVIQADLAKVGIKVSLVGEESDSYYSRQKNGDFDMIFNNSWGPPYEPHAFMSSWRVPSHADYQAQLGLPEKAELDEKIGEVLVSTDGKARASLYKWILTTIHQEAVYLPISYTTITCVYGKNLSSVGFGATTSEIPFESIVKK
jgi:nickel transport system substrate-binding protein